MGEQGSIPALLRLAFDGALIAICLQAPGWLLLRLLLRARWPALAPFRKSGNALVVSAMVLGAFQSLVFVLPAAAVQAAGRLFFLGCILAAAVALRDSFMRRRSAHGRGAADQDTADRGAADRPPYGALALVLALFVLGSFRIALMAEVPGPLLAGYGDLPSYYRVVDNLSAGHFPLVDFKTADLHDEIYFLPTHYPLLALVSAFFQTALPDNVHVLTLVCIVIGAFGLWFSAGFLFERYARREPRRQSRHPGLALLAFGLLPLVPAGHAHHFVLGVIALPVMTFALVLWDLAGNPRIVDRRHRVFLLALCAAATCLLRPEGLMLVALLAFLWPPALVLKRSWSRSRRTRTLAALAAAGWLLVPLLVPYQRLLGKTPSLFYLHWIEAAGSFQVDHDPEVTSFEVAYDHARERVGLKRQTTRINHEILREIFEHPLAYARVLASSIQFRLGDLSLALVLISMVLLAASGGAHNLVLAVFAPLYFVVLASINSMFAPRHSIAATTLLVVAAAAAALDPKIPRRFLAPISKGSRWLLPLILLELAILSAGLAEGHRLRLEEQDSPYLAIVDQLRTLARPGDRLASTYPQLLSYALGNEAVGSSVLFETLEPFLATYAPNLVVLDDARPDLPAVYFDAREFVAAGNAAKLGFDLAADDPERRFLVLAKQSRAR